MELTLLEVNLDEPSFSAKAPFSGAGSGDELDGGMDGEMSTDDEEMDESGRSPVPFLVGLFFLVAIGLAVRRMRGGDSEAADEAETEPIAA